MVLYLLEELKSCSACTELISACSACSACRSVAAPVAGQVACFLAPFGASPTPTRLKLQLTCSSSATTCKRPWSSSFIDFTFRHPRCIPSLGTNQFVQTRSSEFTTQVAPSLLRCSPKAALPSARRLPHSFPGPFSERNVYLRWTSLASLFDHACRSEPVSGPRRTPQMELSWSLAVGV